MRKTRFFLALIAMTMLVNLVEAKNREKAWEFSAMGGWMNTDEIDDPEVVSSDNSGAIAFRFGYHFSATLETEITAEFNKADTGDSESEFVRAALVLTGNFLTDRDTRTIPYISAGLGVINQTVDAYTLEGPIMDTEVGEQFDSAALLTIGFGARTFFNDWFGLRYQIRYLHHNTFEENQDEFLVGFGVTIVVGGE